jgi:hypothetical protein
MHTPWQTFAHPLGGPLSVEQGREIGALVFLPRPGASGVGLSPSSDPIAAQVFSRHPGLAFASTLLPDGKIAYTDVANSFTVAPQTFAGANGITNPFGSGGSCESFGASAGNNSATGQQNTVVGASALTGVTSGYRNVVVGYGAATAASGAGTTQTLLTTGIQNVILGAFAGVNSASASAAIAIGFGAVANNASIAIGNVATTTGASCVAIGQGATAATGAVVGPSCSSSGGGGAFGSTAVIQTTVIGGLSAGRNTTGSHNFSSAIGWLSTTTRSGQIAFCTSNGTSINTVLTTQLLSSTSTIVDVFDIQSSFISGTFATYTTRTKMGVWDYGAAFREVMRFEGNGTAALFGAFGTTAVAQQSGDVATALSAYGWVASPTYSGVPNIKASVALTNQGADVTTTNLATVAGTYQVGYSLQDTDSDITAGAVTLTLSYTDGAGATTATATQVLTGTGRTSGVVYLQLASGNLTYATSHTGIFGSAKYALYIDAVKLQ